MILCIKYAHLMHPGEHTEHILPPLALLPAGALDKRHPLGGSDGQGEGVARHILPLRHLQHARHVDHILRDGSRL